MKPVLYILLILLLLPCRWGAAQLEDPDDLKTDKGAEKDASLNVNIDTMLLYGQYNSINSDFSVTQDFKNFSYQLNSDFKRSNDYGYSNTSFFENRGGFSGMADFSDSWKFIPSFEVDNDSRGMYTNPLYSREEKDHIALYLKNEYTPTPARWNFNLGGAHYVHRIVANGSGGVSNQSFYKVEGQIGWEYSWSAAVLAKITSKIAFYDYTTTADSDVYVANELIGSFKMTEYILITLGPTYSWNRDDYHFGGGTIAVSTVNMKNFTMEIGYQYDLKPFEPEQVYKDQKFIYPDFNMDPEKIHRAEGKFGFEWRNDSGTGFYIKSFKLKTIGIFERHDGFYNNKLIEGNLITPYEMALTSVRGRGEMTLELQIGTDSSLKIGANYEYNYYNSSQNVTYRPVYTAGASMKLQVYRFGLDWNNTLMGSVFIDPESDEKLDRIILGSVSLNYQVLESFYLYGKVENIYGTHYHFRVGYPEPGRLFLGGLRLQI